MIRLFTQVASRSIWLRLAVFIGLVSCIDPLPSRFEQTKGILVVDGMISNRPGPYTVRLSLANASLTLFNHMLPVPNAVVQVCDDLGVCETLVEKEEGVYVTKSLTGVVGRTYRLTVRTADATVYQSQPERMLPPGKIHDFRYEITDFPNDAFDVSVDASLPATDSASFVKFDWTGVYEVLTFPSLKTRFLPSMRREDLVRVFFPPECSGMQLVVRSEDPLDTSMVRRGPCKCCTCWVYDEPAIPTLAESSRLREPVFNDVLVTRVPIDRRTMYAKYVLKVVSQTLSKRAYHFWEAVKKQKTGAVDLFQPPIGFIPGNIFNPNNPNDKVLGIFYAASASDTVAITLHKDMVPFELLPIDTAAEDCMKVFLNSTTTQPHDW